jgi:hypothetical protein
MFDKEQLSPYNLGTVSAVQWGVVHEQSAVQSYSMMDAEVAETG